VADERGSTSATLTADPYGSPDHPYPDELTKVLAAVESVEPFHQNFCKNVERRYKAYRGIAEKKRESTQTWRSSLTTPYILQVLEGMLATLLDAHPKWEVQPKPMPGDQLADITGRQQSGKVASAALQWAMDEDNFPLKQRPFMQQDLIAGVTVAKTLWAYECRDLTRLMPMEVEVSDDWGRIVDKYTSSEEQTQENVCIRDGPSMIVRDVRDFFWPEGAKSMDDAAWVVDRSWETWDMLKAKEDAGYYKNVDELKEARNEQSTQDLTDREQLLWNQERNKNLIEVLEYWTDEQVITVGGRRVVLASKKNPLRISRKPFVVCSAMPDAFQIPGVSVVEALAQIQEYLWTIQNQRLDALRLLTNVITIIRSDVDDPDAFEFYPGAQWQVEDPGQVSQLQIDPTAAQITMEAESLLKGDLQNIMGGLSFAGGTESGLSNAQNTATGMSIVTSIAQRIIQARKQHYMWAFSQVGRNFLGMMGQMLREERVVPQLGKGGSQQLLVVHPLQLQGEFDVQINVMDESSVKQEKMAEAMALVNMAAQLGGPQAGLDLKPFVTRVLDANGIENPEQFFTQGGPPAGGQMPPPQPQGTPPDNITIQNELQPGPPQMGSQGMTNIPLAAGMGGGQLGPGQGLSQTPQQFAQQQVQAVQQLGMG